MRRISSLSGFLIENLRGPALKLGCVVVAGHTSELPIISSRVKGVLLFAEHFHGASMFGGATYRKPPALPDNVHLRSPLITVPNPIGSLIVFHDMDIDCGTIEFVSGARIMGPVDCVRRFLKGRKFFVLNRHKDFICMELAEYGDKERAGG